MKQRKLYITIFLLLQGFLQLGLGLQAQSQNTLISILTDGTSYVTGEQVWCSIRISDPATGKQVSTWRIMHGALLDEKGTALIQVKFSSDNGMASGYIPLPANLVSGIYLVTVITGDTSIPVPLKPILVINPNKPPPPARDGRTDPRPAFNNNSSGILIQPSRPAYGKREKISIDLDAGEAGNSRLSVSIRRMDTLENFADSLLSGLNISAVPVAGSAAASWEGQLLRARVYPANGTNPVSNVQVYVSVIGSEARIAEAVSDANGELSFLLPLVYADAQLVFMPVHSSGTGYRVEFNPDPVEKIPGIQLPPLELPEWLSGPIRNRAIEAQVQNSFRTEEKTRLLISNPDTTDFYGRPGKRYMLDDYTRFPNMEEIITEFVTEVRVRKNREIPEMQVLNAPYKRFFEEPAMVLIDGVPVTDIRQLLELDPLKLQSIDIVSRRFFMGNRSFPGIIHYKSYQGNLGGYMLPVDAAVYNFEGVQLQKEYLAPDYSLPADTHIPDFRNLLYWSPSVFTDNNGKKRIESFSSDLVGSYKIMVNGTSASGKSIVGSARIDIN